MCVQASKVEEGEAPPATYTALCAHSAINSASTSVGLTKAPDPLPVAVESDRTLPFSKPNYSVANWPSATKIEIVLRIGLTLDLIVLGCAWLDTCPIALVVHYLIFKLGS